MSTALDLIKSSLRQIGVASRGATLTSGEVEQAKEALNQMLMTWSARGVTIPYRTRESFALAASKSVYMLGVGGDLNTVRPVEIEGIAISSGGVDYVVREYSLDQYNSLGIKDIVGIPNYYYYEPSYPLGKLYFDYQPATTLIIDSLKPLDTYASQTTSVSLPEGYEEAIKYNLAVRIAPEYGRSVSPEVGLLAQSTYDAIYGRALSMRKKVSKVDRGLRRGGGYNILRDQ